MTENFATTNELQVWQFFHRWFTSGLLHSMEQEKQQWSKFQDKWERSAFVPFDSWESRPPCDASRCAIENISIKLSRSQCTASRVRSFSLLDTKESLDCVLFQCSSHSFSMELFLVCFCFFFVYLFWFFSGPLGTTSGPRDGSQEVSCAIFHFLFTSLCLQFPRCGVV